MTVARVIAELESRGIVLSLADGEIRYRSPKGALTESDKDALRARRAEITAYLQARNAARGLRGRAPAMCAGMWCRCAAGR